MFSKSNFKDSQQFCIKGHHVQTKVTLQTMFVLAQKEAFLSYIGLKKGLHELLRKSQYNLFLKEFSFEISQKLLE